MPFLHGVTRSARHDDVVLAVARCALRNSAPSPFAVRSKIMAFQQIKRTLAVAWVLVAIIVGVAAGVRSTGGLVALAALGLLPPLALMLLWQEPVETMSESIRGGRR
jgi:hypothetical protein